MRYAFILLAALICLAPPALAADGGETIEMTDGRLTDKDGKDVSDSGMGDNCDMSGFKEALGGRESSGDCSARRTGSQFMGKYQLGKRTALADIGWTDANGNWIIDMTDARFLSSCEIQEEAMDLWLAHMAGEIKTARTADGQLLTSYIGKPIPHCPDKMLTFSGLLGGRHLCGLGYKGSRANSGKCYRKGYTGLIAYFESGGAKNGVDGLNTQISEYICKFNGYHTPWDDGGDFSSCGGGMTYGGTPGGSKIDFDPEGYYGDNYDPNPKIRAKKVIREGIRNVWIAGLQLMAEQLTVSMMKQVEIIGTFFDAKHQLETQRLFQQKTAQAHKDYHPSEQMCTFGTFARGLANTERRADLSHMALAQRGLQRETAGGDSITVQGRFSDLLSRFDTWRETFCNPADNAHGNKDLCTGNPDPDMINKDIDFTRAIDLPLTLGIDLLDPAVSNDEKAVFALLDHLYMPDPPLSFSKELSTSDAFILPYQELRSVMAMRAVARNSLDAIIAQKSAGPPDTEGEGSNAPFLYALIKDMGITDEEEIAKLLGERPSYWAQMEVLTKKLYQHPEFTVNLYDKPANVQRMRAAMRAVKTMQDRDIYEALARREMLLSLLSELAVRREQARVTDGIRRLNATR